MTVREYIGARYVPLFMGDWDNTKTYEPLSIVQYQGNSYTSRQFVPTGIEIDNEIYWAQSGNYNAQIEQYVNVVSEYQADVEQYKQDAMMQFETVEEMCESENTDWKYCIVVNGYSDMYCNVEKSTIYKRIVETDYEYTFDGLYVLSNDDKVMPCEDFNDCDNDFEEHLAAIAGLMCNKGYSYKTGYGVFAEPFYNGDKVGQCTTLGYMYMLGLKTKNSRYTLGENAHNKIPPIAFYHKNGLQDEEGYEDNYAWAKYSAMEALTSGYGFKPSDITDIRIGDIIYSGGLDDEPTTVLLNAGHCEIVTSIDYNTKTFVVWEWGSTSPNVLRTGQGSNNSPSVAIKSWDSVKDYIKIVCRLPLKSTKYPTNVFKLGEELTRTLTTQAGSSYTFGNILGSSLNAKSDSGMYKIKINIEPVENPVRFAVGSANADVINGTYVGLSPLTYGGECVFYAPIVATNNFSLIAISQNRIEMNIKITNVEIDILSDQTVFDIRNNSLFTDIEFTPIESSEIETTRKGYFNNNEFVVSQTINNIDWDSMADNANVLNLRTVAVRWPENTYEMNPTSRSQKFVYNQNNIWSLDDNYDKPTNGTALRIVTKFPITCGAFYWAS